MKEKEKSGQNGLLYILFWEGANGGKVEQVRLFGSQTSSDVRWSNKFGDLFHIQSF
jgi:hypothetical protein